LLLEKHGTETNTTNIRYLNEMKILGIRCGKAIKTSTEMKYPRKKCPWESYQKTDTVYT
jgi:hypothetical protein